MVKVMSFDNGQLKEYEGDLDSVLKDLLGESSPEPQHEEKHECEDCRKTRLLAGELSAQAWVAGYVFAETGHNVISDGLPHCPHAVKAIKEVTEKAFSMVADKFKGTPFYDGAKQMADEADAHINGNGVLAHIREEMDEIRAILESDTATDEEKEKAGARGMEIVIKGLRELL